MKLNLKYGMLTALTMLLFKPCQGDKALRIRIEWTQGQQAGMIGVDNGSSSRLTNHKRRVKVSVDDYHDTRDGNNALVVDCEDVNLKVGPGSTVITVDNQPNAFSFFLRDVTSDYPIYIPAYGVMVLRADDPRSYEDVE